jgi:uncharacterized membrane protein
MYSYRSTDNGLNRGLMLLAGLGFGVGLMSLLDPISGGRRRALVRDKVSRTVNKTGDALGATARDVRHRTRGLLAETRARFGPGAADDQVLAERVRSAMGRVVSHPRSIEVTAQDGRVTLSGPILADEVDRLLSTVSSVRGVQGVDNRLEVHQEPGDVPGLQGGVRRPGARPDILQENWSPTTRLLVGAAGGALALWGLGRRDAVGTLAGLAGLGMVVRGLTDIETSRLLGVGAGRRAIDVQKDINILAPVDKVFEFWSAWENFPRFMRNVREVRDLGGDRTRWVVAGPAGVPVEWDAEVTRFEPNEVIAWKTIPGSTVDNAGIVQFRGNPDGTTTVDVRLSYNPPAGAVGHAVATVFLSDPKTEMDEDLNIMKQLIEQGERVHVESPAAGERR